jgi:hypothetical protein
MDADILFPESGNLQCLKVMERTRSKPLQKESLVQDRSESKIKTTGILKVFPRILILLSTKISGQKIFLR